MEVSDGNGDSVMNLLRWFPCLPALFAIALATPLCLAGESPIEKSGPSIESLAGREWRIRPPAEDQSQTWPHRALTRRVHPYIVFTDGTITGSPGCGTLIGTYHVQTTALQ